MAFALFLAVKAALTLLSAYILDPFEFLETFFPDMWPFQSPKTFDPASEISDLSDRVILVTGGNNGIGKETVLQLARHNPKHIYLAARTESKASDAISSIRSEFKDVAISWLPLDLTSLPSIKSAAETVNQQSDRLDILILNAGIMATPPGRTASGQDIQMGTNHVGHFLLTTLLLPKLRSTASLPGADVRIVSVASEANQMAPGIDTITSTEKLVATGPWTRYGASKASNIMFAAELARRYPEVMSVSVHPGLIKTDLYNPSAKDSWLLRNAYSVAANFAYITVPKGALTQLYVAVGAKRQDLHNGGYYKPYGRYQKNKWASNAADAKKLWDWTEAELTQAGY